MTTTQQLDISVLSAPLAAIDRRSLSQAWYSALHLARDGSSPKPAAPRSATVQGSAPRGVALAARPPRTGELVPVNAKTAHATLARGGGAVERRTPRSPLAGRIERALFERPSAHARSAFAIGEGTGRVVVVLHATGTRVRLIALCSPSLRRTVSRALDQARFALAARGIAMDGGVLEGAPACS
ncbi:MAG TPA: hypothetical protein VK760_01930 [Candidatus Acidoferrales bacterium]|jgi:hypothetical protein|nr:hypothetical protein [Candidatus Acidoferrales bacterium]